MKDFVKSMNEVESKVWNPFLLVTSNFLGKKKSYDHVELFKFMLSNLQELGCNIRTKINFFHLRVDRFLQNLDGLSEERIERFQQDLLPASYMMAG